MAITTFNLACAFFDDCRRSNADNEMEAAMKTSQASKAGKARTSSIAARAALCGAAMLVGTAAYAADATGTWLNEDKDAIVQIADCSAVVGPAATRAPSPPPSGQLCGTVVWLKTPIDPATGAPALDKKNTDPSLRGRSILGMRGISGMRSTSTAGRWDGRVYNVDDGKSYDGSMILKSDNELRVQGCVLLICQGETWTRSAMPAAPAGTTPVRPSPATAPQRAR
jgi:uncharacterized protein (DUF2147 family)